MVKFLVRLALFIAVLALCDALLGVVLPVVEKHAVGGQPKKTYEIKNNLETDVLILGSSRSVHHYNPEVLEDSLGKSVYIAGQDGNGIVMMYPLLCVIGERCKPKLVVYDITPDFDLRADDMHRYLSYIRQMWGHNEVVDSVILSVDSTERVKLLSNAFRYNSKIPSLMKGLVGGKGEFYRGFSTVSGVLPEGYTPPVLSPIEYSDDKMLMFDSMISYCRRRDIPLVFVFSPFFKGHERSSIDYFAEFAASRGIDFLDYSACDSISFDPSLFADSYHLNETGAAEFSTLIADKLREYIKE